MVATPLYQQMSRALGPDGRAAAILQRMIARNLSWSEFSALDLPEDVSPEAMWDVLRLVRRAIGVREGVADLEANEYWYLRTHEIADATARIQCLCRPDSTLYRELTATQHRKVLVQSKIDETIAAALLDGLEIAEADAYALLQLDRMPRNDNERFVRNSLTALDDLNALVNVPFSPDLFQHLRYLLLEGVNVKGLRVTKPRMGLMTSDYSDEEIAAGAELQLERISDYLNHTTGDEHDHPVMRALLAPDLFRYYRPLPDVNSEVGRLAFRLYALKVGLPVLGMLPLSRVKLQWEDGLLDAGRVTLQPEVYLDTRNHDWTDLTPYVTLSLQLALEALADLNGKLQDLEERDEELRTLLQQDPLVNHRQRSILGRALRTPTAEFRIAHHKNTHNVVYATARADLLGLVDKGFLEVGKNGRAMVFRARPDLQEFIRKTYGPPPSTQRTAQ